MAVEDFTTYTEVDPNNHIALQGTNHIDATVTRNEDAYLYKDKGNNHFGDFEHKIDIRIPSAAAADSWIAHWVLNNNVDDIYGNRTAGKTQIYTASYRGSGTMQTMYIVEDYAKANYYHQLQALVATWYYLTIKKAGTALTCKIYSDSARTTLLTTLSLVLHADHKFRYIYATNSHNDNQSYQMDADIENLDLQEPAVGRSFGYIIG